mgnify:CR=1 FL=1
MKSKTSFFNWTLFRRNLLRTMPLWIIYTLVLLIVLPLSHLDLNIFYLASYLRNSGELFSSTYSQDALFMSNLAHPVYGVILAAILFGYLNKTRSAYMLHAFPVTRSGLFVTNYCSGLVVMLVPQLLTAVMSLLLCSGAHTGQGALAVSVNLGLMFLQYLFFYGLAVFCMHLTGKTAAGVLTTLILNVLVWTLESLTRETVRPLLYGIPEGETTLLVLSPFVDFFTRMGDSWKDVYVYCCILGAVGLGLTALGWLLYRKRHMERAGDVVAFRWARPIFKYLFTYLITMVLGWLFSLILLGNVNRENVLLLAVLLGVACVIGCFVAEMMLKRTVKVFHWKQFVSCACCLTVLWGGLALLYNDTFGIIRRIPDQTQVEAVELELGWDWKSQPVQIESPEGIRQILEYHQAVLAPEKWTGQVTYEYDSVTLRYHLKNGQILNPPELNLQKLQQRGKANLAKLDAAYKRLSNPHIYGVGLETDLYNTRQMLIQNAKLGR